MPEISRFHGIVIAMYHNDHGPAHFHARHGDENASIAIQPLGILKGHLSKRVHGLVVRWASQHIDELLDNWQRMRRDVPLRPIEPLR